MSAVWTNLEGHVANGVFPLHRCVGSSDHSGVFLTESARHAPSAVALKLVRIAPTFTDAQPSRWLAATRLSHPHLMRIFETGQCQAGELHCLYALMEYAEQNLAQLLEQRALADDEAREMLMPTLSVLAYLHESNLVHGQLKPSNILVVGDQLKLASDTVRAVGESAYGMNAALAYIAPEVRHGGCSAAGDIWALGVTMCEALTHRWPSGLHGGVGEVELPSDLHPPFREIVARCLSKNPRDRPEVAELQAWLHGEHAMAISLPPSAMPERAADQPAASERSVAQTAAAKTMDSPVASAAPVESQSKKPSTLRLVIRAEIIPEGSPRTTPARQPLNRRALLLVLGAVAVLTLSWVGTRLFRTDPTSAPVAREGAPNVESHSAAPPVPASNKATPVVSDEPHPKPASSTVETRSAEAAAVVPPSVAPRSTAKSAGSEVREDAGASSSPINEVIPNVPRSALQTIRGTIRVSVRVIVDKDGKVLTATPDDPGSSRYFERLAIAASKKWTFAPATTEEQRMMLVRFSFTREGTTARANPLQ